MRKKRVVVGVDKEDVDILDKIKLVSGATISELVRRAIKEYIKNKKHLYDKLEDQ